MSAKREFYQDREVGWMVTKDWSEPSPSRNPNRVGWGQLRVHATESEDSFDNLVRPKTIFVDKSLTEHMIPAGERVRWRSFSDDDVAAYSGIVRANWLLSDDQSDLAYNIDRFNMTDVGAVHVYYSSTDIIVCARAMDRPNWERFALAHNYQKQIPGESGQWIEVYG